MLCKSVFHELQYKLNCKTEGQEYKFTKKTKNRTLNNTRYFNGEIITDDN